MYIIYIDIYTHTHTHIHTHTHTHTHTYSCIYIQACGGGRQPRTASCTASRASSAKETNRKTK